MVANAKIRIHSFTPFADLFTNLVLPFIIFPSPLSSPILYFNGISPFVCGPGSSVGMATDYGLDGPGSNPDVDEIFRPSQTGPGTHPASCTMGAGSFPGVNCGRDVLLTTHPILVPRSWKSRAKPLPTLWATPGL